MIRRLLPLILLLSVSLPILCAPAAAEQALDRQRLTEMLRDRDPLLIEQIFRRHAQGVLPFIDGFLEDALKQVESGSSEAEATAQFDRGLAFARIASRAFGDDIFERYAASFASWSDSERVRFRSGQRAYRDGLRLEREEAFDEARTAFRRALYAAERLDDSWGIAMALNGLARTEQRRGNTEESVRHSRRSADLYRRLRMNRQEAESMLIAAHALEESEMVRPSLTNSSRAYAILQDAPDDPLRRRAVETYLRGLEASGQTEEAQRIRQQEEDRAAAQEPGDG